MSVWNMWDAICFNQPHLENLNRINGGVLANNDSEKAKILDVAYRLMDVIPTLSFDEEVKVDFYLTSTFFIADCKNGDYNGVPVYNVNNKYKVNPRVPTNPIKDLLLVIGEDPDRGGLLETPDRVMKAWKQWTSGYGKDVKDILKTFEDGGETYNQMVSVIDIPFYSHCEHHLAPFFGTATIAYIPDGRVVGLSKLSRVLDMYARRLQVQERLTEQVADALFDNLRPKGVGVAIRARHMCMESRGICQQGHHTLTTALRGVILQEVACRQEFLSLVHGMHR